MSSVSNSTSSPSRPTTPHDSEESDQQFSEGTSRDVSETSSIVGQDDSDDNTGQDSEYKNADDPLLEGLLFAQPPVHHQIMAEGDSSIVESMSVSMLLPHDKVTTERASKLQRKYLGLREALQRSQTEEKNLLVQARDLSKTLNEQRKALDRAADFPDNANNTEGGKLRKQILECENGLAQSAERMEQLEYEIRLLMEEKKEMEKDFEKRPKAEDIEQKVRDFTGEIEELQYSLKKVTEEATLMKSDVKVQQAKIENYKVELTELAQAESNLKDDLVKVRTEPQIIVKDIDALRKDLVGADNEKENLSQQLIVANDKASEMHSALHRLGTACAKVDAEVRSSNRSSEKLQYELERIKKDGDSEKDREATLLEDRATQELQFRHRVGEVKLLHEAVTARVKEKNKSMKMSKASELQLKVLQEAVEQQAGFIVNVEEKKQLSSQVVAENRSVLEDVRAELDQMRHWVANQAGLEEVERIRVEHHLEAERRLKAQVRSWQETVQGVKKDVVAATKARDKEAKEQQKAEHAKWRVADNLKSKKNVIDESVKSLSHLEQQLKEFSSAYEMVKTERNKTMSLTQHASQVQTELHEKVHVLVNEKEILLTSVDNKERLLQKCALVHSHKVMARDTLRQEMAKKVNMQSDLSTEMEQQRTTTERILNKINEAEADMIKLRKRYEGAVQERNEQGLRLIERNEELSIFYEKLNLQDSIIQKANLQLKSREDDIHFLRMENAELKRAVCVGRKQTKDKRQLENELVEHQIELLETTELLSKLENKMETPKKSRVRLLEGSDLSHTQLHLKIEDLENRVADADEKLLEKELLHDQVNRITERLDNKVKGVRASGLSVSEKVSACKLKIEDVTRKMMALVSELTMQQAKARQLQQAASEQESSLEEAYVRLESGEPPSAAIREQWDRMERMQSTRQQDSFIKKQLAAVEEQYTLSDGTVSTADPRPNAYLPQGNLELPLPKPYGALAPFRPSQPGATMRHIRKPEPKPIDI